MGVLPTLPTSTQLEELWAGYRHKNIAVLTAQRSGVMVGDVDPRHGGKIETLWALGWPQHTPIAQSGGGGWHVYVACPPEGMCSISNYAEGIELKANGALVIAPPSIHPDTKRLYEWKEGHEPWILPVAPLPNAVLADMRQHTARVATVSGKPDPDRDNPNALVYDLATTRRIATALYRKALHKAHRGEGRNNALFWLSRQLDSLGMARAEIVDWGIAFVKEVQHV
jgi:hypothetical protein